METENWRFPNAKVISRQNLSRLAVGDRRRLRLRYIDIQDLKVGEVGPRHQQRKLPRCRKLPDGGIAENSAAEKLSGMHPEPWSGAEVLGDPFDINVSPVPRPPLPGGTENLCLALLFARRMPSLAVSPIRLLGGSVTARLPQVFTPPEFLDSP